MIKHFTLSAMRIDNKTFAVFSEALDISKPHYHRVALTLTMKELDYYLNGSVEPDAARYVTESLENLAIGEVTVIKNN